MRRRGVVIPTAMFLVLVLFALITAIHMSVQRSFQVTKHGHGQTRARYLARAAVQSMVAALNADASVETAHKGEQNAKVVPAPDGSALKAWVVADEASDVLHVVGTSTTPDGYSDRAQAVVRRYKSKGLLYVRLKPNDHAVTFFWKDGAQPNHVAETGNANPSAWAMINPIPTRLADDADQIVDLRENRDDNGDFVSKVRGTAADHQGRLYVAVARDKGDRVVRYEGTTKQWTLLPDLPVEAYGENGNLQPRKGPARLELMASDGNNLLYTVRSVDDVDTVLAFDHSSQTWRHLPAVRENDDGEARGNLQDLAADGRGHVYARKPQQGKEDLLLEFTPSDTDTSSPTEIKGTWRSVRSPRTHFTKSADENSSGSDDGVTAYFTLGTPPNLDYLSASPQGDLYAVYSKDGLDTLFRSPAPKVERRDSRRTWSMLAPPTRSYHDLSGERVDDDGLALRLRHTAFDARSQLYVRWDRNEEKKRPDALFVYENPNKAKVTIDYDDGGATSPVDPRLHLLPPMDRCRWKKQAGADGPEKYIGDPQKIVKEAPDLIGGGTPNDSGGAEYDIVGTY